ncbi:MAG TPA: RagB/SusD family nutrient uptake outer membrane protein [Chitinophagaceae bacterium]|nr:RagB/SusD family nutrient uptake outer membrane protein [Chitinophagaceae bacterium]
MKHKINFLGALILLLLLASCKKNYLTRDPYNAVSLSTAIKSESDLSVALNGAYSSLRSTNLYGRDLPVKGDLMADNTFITTSNSNRYITMNNFTMTAVSGDYGGLMWAAAYVAIKSANTVIQAGASLPNTSTVNQYIGEAYAIRGLMYFELVRNFAHPYTAAPNDPGVPIVSDSLVFDPSITNYKPARSAVKDVYAKVISDLEKAYSLMTSYRGTAFFSKYAARALEARVYQNMGDWTNAKTVALDVINNSGWTMLPATAYVNPSGNLGTSSGETTNAPPCKVPNTYSPGGYWANPSVQTAATKNETFFEVSSDLLSNNGFDQIGFIYTQIGGGYGDVLATDDLYNLYSPTDVRRGLIPRAPATPSGCSGQYRSGQAGNINLCYKYPNPANGADKDDTKIIRLSDVILILAEAYYNLGDIPNANLYLNKVAQQRDPSFAGYSDTGTQVLEDILTERRKEFAFEGSRLWDLIRLQRSWTKYKNQSPLATISVTPSNTQLVYPIPQGELDANKNITQNPGY